MFLTMNNKSVSDSLRLIYHTETQHNNLFPLASLWYWPLQTNEGIQFVVCLKDLNDTR